MKKDFEDYLIDAKLHIETTGKNDRLSDEHFFPYEPTSFTVLDRLIESGNIGKDDCLLDLGCGKGRVPIYLNYKTGCRTIGVEIMDEFYTKAVQNVNAYCKHLRSAETDDISIEQAAAQNYEIPSCVNRIFFFNPFSVAVFKSVMGRIIEAYYSKPRKLLLFFYYPQDEYIAYLSGIDEILFFDEIDCMDLFTEKDARNRIMIFEII
jgi:SAM-dependent methyltransferase